MLGMSEIQIASDKLRIGLEFAPGTKDDCKRLVGSITTPGALLAAYRDARILHGNGDIVLVIHPDQSADINGGTRWEFCRHLRQLYGDRASAFGVWHKSAHAVVQLPKESEAMWLVIHTAAMDLPIMCVIYTTPYEVAARAS